MELAERLRKINSLTNVKAYNKELQFLIDALPFYTMLIDEDHNIIFENKAMSNKAYLLQCAIAGGYCLKTEISNNNVVLECPIAQSANKGVPVECEFYDASSRKWLMASIYPTELKSNKSKKLYLYMIKDISRRKKNEEDLKEMMRKVKEITDSGINAIGKIIEMRDPYTALHQAKVGSIAYLIAKELGASDKEAQNIQAAGVLHDVGKSAVPIGILYKPGKLTKYEFEDIKNHPLAGYEILKEIEYDIPLAKVALQHHERLDGSGYPNGLKGDEILYETRIISVADVIDAMTSHRPYRPRRTMQETIDELEKNAGLLYDKKVVQAAVKLCREGVIDPESLCFVQ